MKTLEKEDQQRIDKLKILLGVDIANCSTCLNLGSDGDGPEYCGDWPICEKIERMGYLKSFPFEKEMKCWEPEFWKSKFSALIIKGTDEEVNSAGNKFRRALESITN